WTLAHRPWTLILLLFVLYGCSSAPKPGAASDGEPQESGRVTFVQWSDPHVFDAGAARQGKEIEEEQLDNWSALHWAVMQTNRLVTEDRRKIDFVVITGDFGLYNLVLPGIGNKGAEPCRRDPREGPG